MLHTFGKSEKLKSEKTISQIFRGGNSYVAYPLRVVWILDFGVRISDLRAAGENENLISSEAKKSQIPNPKSQIKIGISVPKKTFKTAVSRNRIKRLIREAWRLNKHLFYEKIAPGNFSLNMMLVYVAKEELPFAEIEKGVLKAVRKFEVPPKK